MEYSFSDLDSINSRHAFNLLFFGLFSARNDHDECGNYYCTHELV